MARIPQLPHRRRKQHERKPGSKPLGRRILIVCEGKKTEPYYLEEIRILMRLPTATIHVSHEDVTAPRQIVDAAERLFEQGENRFGKALLKPRAVDVVVAVFDRDQHDSYHDALKRMQQLDGMKRKNDDGEVARWLAIPSNSCFELWLLLHVQEVQTAIHRDDALRRVKQNFPDYEKGSRQIFSKTRQFMSIAIERAYRLTESGSWDPWKDQGPYTGMHLLTHLLLDPEFPLPSFPSPVTGEAGRIEWMKARWKI